jgi:chitin disaccharide deacetylase
MLIITADDWGVSRDTTDNILLCLKKGRISSVSAMVFMRDSEHAAEIALEYRAEAGLHLNFSNVFDGAVRSKKLQASQMRLSGFLEKGKYAPIFYNPFLKDDFEYVCMAQYDEYMRLYGMPPTFINGHRHKHLCSNVLIDGLIPKGSRVRRTFTFNSGEKNIFNLIYRRLIDLLITRRYVCTDFFFSLSPINKMERLQRIVYISSDSVVELMVHPGKKDEFDYLMSDEYYSTTSSAVIGNYCRL